MAPTLPKYSRVAATEHQHSHRGVLPTDLRRRARRRAPALGLGRARRVGRTAEERGHGHVRVCGGAAVHYPPEPGRVHLAGVGGRGADHRGVRSHRAAAPHADAARLQVVAFLSRALGAADVPLDSVVQRTRLFRASFFSYFPSLASTSLTVRNCFLGYDLAVLLPRHRRHVQLCFGHLWLRNHLRGPHLVFHTSEQVAAPGADRAGDAHGRGSP